MAIGTLAYLGSGGFKALHTIATQSASQTAASSATSATEVALTTMLAGGPAPASPPPSTGITYVPATAASTGTAVVSYGLVGGGVATAVLGGGVCHIAWTGGLTLHTSTTTGPCMASSAPVTSQS